MPAKMSYLCLVSTLTLCLFVSRTTSAEDLELQFVQLVWRHGDRSPVQLYPTDPNSEDFWQEGLGQLTTLGKKQHYALGKLLHKMYGNFTTSSPLEVKTESCDFDRCRYSAETNLASFYAPSNEWRFEAGFHWQPLSIKYIPKDEDRYLEVGSYCPEAFREEKRILNSKEGQAIVEENSAMFQYLSNHSGSTVDDWVSAGDLYDTLMIEKKYNLSVPDWAHTYWEQLRNVSSLSFYWSFNSPLMLRLRAGPLLGKLIENMANKIADKLPNQKVQIYSAHDTTVAILLGALKLFNMVAPPYCATVVVELYRANASHVVRLLFLNSSMPEQENQTATVLILPGCTEYCPFEYFVNSTRNLIPDDWEAECKMKPTFYDIDGKSMTAGILLTFLIVIILGTSICFIWRIYSRNRREYAYQFLKTDIN